LTKEALKNRVQSMWRYEEVLPVLHKEHISSLPEGWTPLVPARKLGELVGCPNLFIKDESRNPTGSFKARGLCMALCKAEELKIKEVAMPSAGNAAGALSCYAAVKQIKAHVFMPTDVALSFRAECEVLGAEVNLVNGYITDCGAKVREGASKFGWYDVSTLREPYRMEGKKTMGYEIVEQLNWEVPDVIIYPTGGGIGVIAMWKAFQEMEDMGWIGKKRPRIVVVQATGCAPITKAFEEGTEFATPWKDPKTIAGGLRVPAALGDFLVLKAVRESGGLSLNVTDEEMLESNKVIGSHTGIFGAPEAGACWAALKKLVAQNWLKKDETIVMFNTGTGLKYTHCWVK